jgi:DNA-binding CsgD family transcriptional regulator
MFAGTRDGSDRLSQEPADKAPISVHVTSVPTTAPLLEREHELEALGDALGRASAGTGGLALIEGTPGLGKSRLLAAARNAARERGMRVLEARGTVLEREFVFGIVRQLFESVTNDLSDTERERLFAGSARLAAGLLDQTGPPLAPAQGDNAFGVLHGLYWLTINLADNGPLMLSVDDGHWSDPLSLRFLAYLSRRLDGVPVLVAATGRPFDPESDALWLELSQDPGATLLRPGTLSETAVSALVRARLGSEADESFCRACHRATGGNPLFAHELLSALGAAEVLPTADAAAAVTEVGPPAVARFVLHRLRRLGPSATALAQAVALLGGDAEATLSAQIARLDPTEARQVADLLVRADVFAPDQRLRFAHPIVQAAVYDDLLPGERSARHLAAARLLERAGAPAERVAAQLLKAAPSGEPSSIAALRAAAAKAGEQGDPMGAAAYLRRALEEPVGDELRPELLCELGRTEVATRDFASAQEHLLEVLRKPAAPRQRTRAGVWLARAAITSGRPRSAEAAFEALLGETQPAAEEATLELEAELVTLVRMELTLRHLAPEWLERFGRDAAGNGRFEPIAEIHAASEALVRGEQAAPLADRIEALLPHVPLSDPFAFGVGLDSLIVAERYTSASRWLDVALRAAHAIGFGTRIANLHTQRAAVALARGQVGEAQLDSHTALELAGTDHFYAPRVVAVAVEAALERGELQEAQALIERDSERLAAERLFVDEFLTSRGNLRIALGDVRGGLEDLLHCRELHARYETARPADWCAGAARALAELGQQPKAQELAQHMLAAARRFGAPRALTRALRTAGSVTEGDSSLSLLEEAVAVAAPSHARLELAYAYADLGAALVSRRRRREGREMLRLGIDQALTCGATALAQRLRGELKGGGGRPPPLELTGLAALTPAERRVCDLVARNMSNREAAQTLFVTEKTIELHLTNAYRKLGIRSRFQLSTVIPSAVTPE